MKQEDLYLAMIGDLVRSREAADRAKLQTELEKTIQYQNAVAGDVLAAPLAFTAGDEIQALFRWPYSPERLRHDASVAERLVDTVIRMAAAAHPTRICFGLGGGRLSTALRGDSPARMDGPCFHAAREALHRSQSEERLLTTCALARESAGKSFMTIDDVAPTAVFGLLGALLSEWTPRQVQIALDREHGLTELRRGPATMENPFQSRMRKSVAQDFEISPSVVTEGMQAARYEQFRFGLWAAAILLQEGAKRRWEQRHAAA